LQPAMHFATNRGFRRGGSGGWGILLRTGYVLGD